MEQYPSQRENEPLHPPAETPEYTRVEAERMDQESAPGFSYAHIQQQPLPNQKAPVAATWIFLVLAWLFLGSPALFTIFIGLPLNLIALFLALTCLGRGAVGTGVLGLLMGTVGSCIVYFVSWVSLLGGALVS